MVATISRDELKMKIDRRQLFYVSFPKPYPYLQI